MEKESSSHIICTRCSNEAVPGKSLCALCASQEALNKEASDKPKRSLRETVNNHAEDLFK